MSSGNDGSTVAWRAAGTPLAWRSWPLADGGSQVWGIVLPLAAVAAAVGLVSQSAAATAVACAAVAVSMWRFFVPTYYEIGPLGVSFKALGRRRRIEWPQVQFWEECGSGACLVAARSPRRRQAVFLPFGGYRDEILERLRNFTRGAVRGADEAEFSVRT